MKRIILLSTLVFPVLTLASCNNGAPQSQSTKANYYLRLNESSLSIFESESHQVSVETNIESLSFSSSNTGVASVSNGGRIVARNPGSATITVSGGGLTATCEVSVKSISEKDSDYILIAEPEMVLGLNESAKQHIDAAYYAKDVVDPTKTFTYEVADETIATVSSNGEISVLKEGQTSVSVSSNGISTVVYLDVYTINMKTTDDWMEMLAVSGRLDARFYLANDLDFSGKEYRFLNGYNEDWSKCSYLMGELNGAYHTVSHITLQDNGGKQAIFGYSTAFTLKNISFERIKFTSTGSNDGLFTSLMHHVSGPSGNEIHTTLVSNVICDFEFPSSGGSVIASAFYGGGIENVFASLKGTNDAFLLPSNTYGFCRETYLWWSPNYLNNMICYYQKGDVNIVPKGIDSALPMPLDSLYKTDSLIEADYLAYENFDNNIWDIKPNQIPTFK